MTIRFAIVPAAGRSRRMGQSKLLLPWQQWTVMDQVLATWTGSQVDHTVVVVRTDDRPLQEAVRRWPVHLVRPLTAPRDMKESVCAGLNFIEQFWQPPADAVCLIAPADVPQLSAAVIDRLLECAECRDDDRTAVVPVFGNRRGHPILLPWPRTADIFRLPDDVGIRRLVEEGPVDTVPFAESEHFSDIDTPDEYRAARRPSEGHSGND